jgi:hypothetical protein
MLRLSEKYSNAKAASTSSVKNYLYLLYWWHLESLLLWSHLVPRRVRLLSSCSCLLSAPLRCATPKPGASSSAMSQICCHRCHQVTQSHTPQRLLGVQFLGSVQHIVLPPLDLLRAGSGRLTPFHRYEVGMLAFVG